VTDGKEKEGEGGEKAETRRQIKGKKKETDKKAHVEWETKKDQRRRRVEGTHSSVVWCEVVFLLLSSFLLVSL